MGMAWAWAWVVIVQNCVMVDREQQGCELANPLFTHKSDYPKACMRHVVCTV